MRYFQEPLELLTNLSHFSTVDPDRVQELQLLIEELDEAYHAAFFSVPRVRIFTAIVPEERVVELSTNLLMRGHRGFENAADETVACRCEPWRCSENAPPARPRADGDDRVFRQP